MAAKKTGRRKKAATKARKLGRPSKLTPALRDAIAANVEVGASLEVAAAEALVSRSTLNLWQQRGREADKLVADGKALTGDQQAYLEFSDAIARARARFELNILRRLDTLDAAIQVKDPVTKKLETVNKIDPKIAAALAKSLTWLLERKRREEYGSQITVKVEEAKEYLLDAVERVCERLGQRAVLEALFDELERGGPEEAGASGEATPVERIH